VAFRQNAYETPLPGERISFPLCLPFGGRRVRFGYPALRKEREGWGIHQLVARMEPEGRFIAF
jgi:hypothetical protein